MKSPTWLVSVALGAVIGAMFPVVALAHPETSRSLSTTVVLATLKSVNQHLTMTRDTTQTNVHTAPYSFKNGDQLSLARKQTASLRYCNSAWVDLRGRGHATVESASDSACSPIIPPTSLRPDARSAPRQQQSSQIVTLLQQGELDEVVGSQVSADVQTGFTAALSAATGAAGPPVVTASPVNSPSNFDVKVTGNQVTLFCITGGVFVHIQNDTKDDQTLGQGQEEIIVSGQTPVVQRYTGNPTAWTNRLPAPVPVAPSLSLLGTWVRTVSQPAFGMTQLTLNNDGGTFTASAQVICSTGTCSSGPSPAVAYAALDAPGDGTGFIVRFRSTGVQAIVTGDLEDGFLEVTAYNVFPDGSGNWNTVDFEEFQQTSPNGSGSGSGTSAPRRAAGTTSNPLVRVGWPTVSPLRNLAAPHDMPSASALLGDWSTANPVSGGIAKIELHSDSSGLTVQAYGVCQPDPCDWGSVPGTSYSASPDSATGIAFSAVFDIGPQETLVTGDIEDNALVVTSFTTFADPTQGPNIFNIQDFQPDKSG